MRLAVREPQLCYILSTVEYHPESYLLSPVGWAISDICLHILLVGYVEGNPPTPFGTPLSFSVRTTAQTAVTESIYKCESRINACN